ncbi:class II fructose-bisphosphate aldolase [Streptomyces sp. CA-249302]
MIDGSHVPFAENIALTKEAVRRARDHSTMTDRHGRPTSWPQRAWTH